MDERGVTMRNKVTRLIDRPVDYSIIDDEPWDSEHNMRFHHQRPDLYACPSDFQKKDRYHTNYLRIVGPGTLAEGPDTVSLEELDHKAKTVRKIDFWEFRMLFFHKWIRGCVHHSETASHATYSSSA